MNSNDPIDGAERREKVVAEGAELRERAVEHARKVGDGLGLKDAPVSPDAPAPYPAPRVPAPPYRGRALKETLPSTPRAIARQVAESLAPLTPLSPEAEPAAAAAPGAATPTATSNDEPAATKP
ncbi:MAG: hypothetical protein JWM10_388 [Myxococcaceae bacterium]|nr:hypothetical protein [Myxococcaceae bacterium]